MSLEPYDYQLEAIEATVDGWRDGVQRGLIVLPTGTGKTLIMGKVVERSGFCTLILEQGIQLVSQTAEALRFLCPGMTVGVLQGSRIPPPGAQIIVASVQTLSRAKHLSRWKDYGFKLVICDEAHHGVAVSYRRIFQELGCFQSAGCRLLGLTATGRRGDRVALGHVYEDIFYQRTLEDMIVEGYLADLRAIRVKTDVQLLDLRTGQKGDFDSEDLEPLINTINRNRLIVETFLQHGKKRKTLCFATSVNHAIHLAADFRNAGISAAHIHGEMSLKARERVMDDFHKGFIQVLTNYNLLIEGYDEPAISCLIMARPTRSWTLYMQMLGRGVRRCEGKENCLIIDVADICDHHQIWDLPTLLGEELKDSPAIAILKKATEQEEPKIFRWNTTMATESRDQIEYQEVAQLIGNRLWFELLELIRRRGYDLQIGINGLTITLSEDEYISVIPEGDGFQVAAVNQKYIFNLSGGVVSPPWALGVTKSYIEARDISEGDQAEQG